MSFEDAPVQITIPTLPLLQPSPFLPDGAPACVDHSGSHATMNCAQCHKAFCELCVHQIRRVGGAALKLCPSCGGHCRAIVQEKIEKNRMSRFGSWLGKLAVAQTGRDQRSGSYQSPRSQSASRPMAWSSRILSSAKAGMRSLRLPKKRVWAGFEMKARSHSREP